MLITRLSRPFFSLSKFRRFSSGHGHEKVLEEYDGINRRINPVVRHETWWDYRETAVEENIYRDPRWFNPERFKEIHIYAVLLSASMWAWLFYHFYYEGHELYAKHYPNPKTDLMSDEHLGIPPDDEGLAREKKWVKTIEIPFCHPNIYPFSRAYLVHHFGDEGPYKI